MTIPADEARQRRDSATYLRYLADVAPQSPVTLMSQEVAALRRAADLLDPQPPSLREQVAEAIHEELAGEEAPTPSCGDCLNIADAVLAVVADWLAAQPLAHRSNPVEGQRNHDVRLLRGES